MDSNLTAAALIPRESLADDDFDDVPMLTQGIEDATRSSDVGVADIERLYRFDAAHRNPDRASCRESQEPTEELFETAAAAIRTKPQRVPIPRTFLLLRSTNPWPSRWTFLSSALFIAGQSFLLWSIPRGLAWGVASGVLASAWAFTMALYVIAQYCDDEYK